MPKVSVIVINWNGAHKLRKYLPEILKLRGVDEFIVTDDASTDESLTVLNDFPEIRVVRRSKNGGFSANVNTASKIAIGDLVFLLNPDAVPDKDCIEKALPYFKDKSVFSVGCNTGGNWSWVNWHDGFIWHFMSKEKDETHQTLWARGGSGIFRKDLLLELGGMDELYNPFYEEDFDLGYMATKRGYKNIWVKECKVTLPDEKGVIEKNISKARFSKIAQRNQLLFIWKNITSKKLIFEHQKALFMMLIKHPKYFEILWMALQKLPEALSKRQVEKNKQKLNDEEILGLYQA